MQAFGDKSRHRRDMERVARLLQDGHETVWPYFPGVRYNDPAKIHPEHWCWVHVDEVSMSLFETLRWRVLRELVRKEIVVESCPTSNLAVANLKYPPLHTLMYVSGLRCVVATDDPGLLDAWPRDEYDLVLRDEKDRNRIERGLLEESKRSTFVRIA